MRIPIMNLDQVGILPDIEPYNLPLTAWSSGKNVRFSEGHVEKARGYQTLLTPLADVDFALPVETTSGYYVLYAGGSAIHGVKETNHYDLTRLSGNFSVVAGNNWTGGSLNGVAVLNHPDEVPQAWLSPGPGVSVQDLPNWPATWRAKSVRPFLYYLVALGITESGAENPYRVAWSHVADPGTVPSSWDISDATKDAGDYVLADTDGALVDQLPLGPANIIYKSDSAYAMRHVGGIDIFGFAPVKKADGLLMPNGFCELDYNGKRHVVFGANDVYLHDGLNSESILRKRIRNWLFRNLDSTSYRNSFIAHDLSTDEILICIPTHGQTRPNVAIVWDYVQDSVSIKDLPSVSFMFAGRAVPDFVSADANSWASATNSWRTETGRWGSKRYSAVNRRLIMFGKNSAGDNKAYLPGDNSTFDGAAVTSVLERVGLNVLGQDLNGKPIYDSDTIKIVTEVWPRFSAPAGTTMHIYVGAQMQQQAPITWTGPFEFVAGRDEKVNPYISGKIISIRFEITSSAHWRLSGYDLEIVSGGKY